MRLTILTASILLLAPCALSRCASPRRKPPSPTALARPQEMPSFAARAVGDRPQERPRARHLHRRLPLQRSAGRLLPRPHHQKLNADDKAYLVRLTAINTTGLPRAGSPFPPAHGAPAQTSASKTSTSSPSRCPSTSSRASTPPSPTSPTPRPPSTPSSTTNGLHRPPPPDPPSPHPNHRYPSPRHERQPHAAAAGYVLEKVAAQASEIATNSPFLNASQKDARQLLSEPIASASPPPSSRPSPPRSRPPTAPSPPSSPMNTRARGRTLHQRLHPPPTASTATKSPSASRPPPT